MSERLRIARKKDTLPVPVQQSEHEVQPLVQEVLSSSGQLLDTTTRDFMEPRFGHDFSQVRIHTDERAAESAQAVNAIAYTIGQDVVFGEGKYAPETMEGKQLLAHELTHAVQNQSTNSNNVEGIEESGSAAEMEASRISHRLQWGLTSGDVTQTNAGVALTPTSVKITPSLSYSLIDWEVTAKDEANILGELKVDPDLSGTIIDLNSSSMLWPLLNRVDETANRRELLQLLGTKLNPTAMALVDPLVAKLPQEWQAQFNLSKMGVTSGAPAFNTAPFASLISSDPTQPFTGSGATGVNPTTLDISWMDQKRLSDKDPATREKYTNPISDRPPGDLNAYLASLTPAERSQQAELLLKQPISTVEPEGYEGEIPSRAQVIRAAAAKHNLHPQLIAAFILAEQRDQSKNEDAKDYLGATSRLKKGNTSIGLGQVVVSTAQRNDLFQDLLSSDTRSKLSHNDIAKLLASDEYNIFAAATYMRKVADDGSKISISTLPNTQARFPSIDMAAYANNSSTWPEDNILALASEYTSKAWDDNLSPGWPDFVLAAYKDVIASGVF